MPIGGQNWAPIDTWQGEDWSFARSEKLFLGFAALQRKCFQRFRTELSVPPSMFSEIGALARAFRGKFPFPTQADVKRNRTCHSQALTPSSCFRGVRKASRCQPPPWFAALRVTAEGNAGNVEPDGFGASFSDQIRRGPATERWQGLRREPSERPGEGSGPRRDPHEDLNQIPKSLLRDLRRQTLGRGQGPRRHAEHACKFGPGQVQRFEERVERHRAI